MVPLLHARVIIRISLGYSSYSYLLSILHFMFKHCFKDRRPCCQINTNVITHRQLIQTGDVILQDRYRMNRMLPNRKKKKLAVHWTMTSWLCDPSNLEKSSLLQLCQHFPSDICHLKKTSRPSISCIQRSSGSNRSGGVRWALLHSSNQENRTLHSLFGSWWR